LTAALAAFVVLLFSAGGALYSHRRAAEWVAHTIEVKAAIGDYLVALVDAETGQRGFVITGKPEYLEPYTRADVGDKERRVRSLTADNASQQAHLAHVSKLAAAKLDELRLVIDLRKHDPRAAVEYVSTDRGKAVMDEIRSVVGTMLSEEDRLFSERRARADRTYVVNLVVLVLASCACGLTLLFAMQLRRDLARAREAELAAVERARTTEYKDRFVAVLGHDLKNPLTAIRVASERLEDKVPPEASALLVRIQRSVERMTRMIDQLLDVTRMRLGGGIPLVREPVDLAAIVTDAVNELRAAFPSRSVELRTDGEARGAFDGDRVAQVVSNLVGNALTHGSPDAAVRVELRGEAERVVLSVASAGTLDANEAQLLFEPFRRDRRDQGKTPRSAGLGLGLAIARHIAEQHGGDLTLDSSGEATVFTATFRRE